MDYPLSMSLVILFPIFISVASYFILKKYVQNRSTLILSCGSILLLVILGQLFFVRFHKKQSLQKTVKIIGKDKKILRTDIKPRSTLTVKKIRPRHDKQQMLSTVEKKLASGEITQKEYDRVMKFMRARPAQ